MSTSMEIKETISKLIRIRKRLIHIKKSYRNGNAEREAIRQVEFYLNTPRDLQGWKLFVKAKWDYIQFITPETKGAKSLLSKLNTLIQ